MTGKKPIDSFAVIFVSRRSSVDDGYGEMANRMVELASAMPGFLGVDSARSDGLGITVSYWESEAAIAAWRQHAEHLVAQRHGRSKWYDYFDLHICRVVTSRTSAAV
jgi:heme-degrading monooxygenase HmoA